MLVIIFGGLVAWWIFYKMAIAPWRSGNIFPPIEVRIVRDDRDKSKNFRDKNK